MGEADEDRANLASYSECSETVMEAKETLTSPVPLIYVGHRDMLQLICLKLLRRY